MFWAPGVRAVQGADRATSRHGERPPKGKTILEEPCSKHRIACTRTCAHTPVHTHPCTHTCAHIPAHTPVHAHLCTHTRAHTPVHTHLHTHLCTHTCTHAWWGSSQTRGGGKPRSAALGTLPLTSGARKARVLFSLEPGDRVPQNPRQGPVEQTGRQTDRQTVTEAEGTGAHWREQAACRPALLCPVKGGLRVESSVP